MATKEKEEQRIWNTRRGNEHSTPQRNQLNVNIAAQSPSQLLKVMSAKLDRLEEEGRVADRSFQRSIRKIRTLKNEREIRHHTPGLQCGAQQRRKPPQSEKRRNARGPKLSGSSRSKKRLLNNDRRRRVLQTNQRQRKRKSTPPSSSVPLLGSGPSGLKRSIAAPASPGLRDERHTSAGWNSSQTLSSSSPSVAIVNSLYDQQREWELRRMASVVQVTHQHLMSLAELQVRLRSSGEDRQ